MEIIERDEQLKNPGEAGRFRISRRDTVLNDLKNSTPEGILSFLLSLLSLAPVIGGIYLSYAAEGKGGYLLGVMMLSGLLIAIGALILGILGFRNRKKIRHYMEKRGIILSVIVIGGLIALYIWGIRIYLN